MNEAERRQRVEALSVCGGVCEVCGKTLTAGTWQGAHRIANTKPNRAKWGNFIIDHPMNISLGGTSIIIVVGVALETVKQLESQMMMRHYKGFLD